MQFNGRLIERYVIGAILPYTLFALFLLTTLLLLQQTGRFAELLFGTGLPFVTLSGVLLWLLPSVVAFTLPMAVLTGTLIGFSRMGSDSELVAMRAAGVGVWKMAWPVLLIGMLLSVLTLYINMEVAPDAARALRLTGLRAALYKLDSPVEPRSFNTDIPGYVVYVRDGDKSTGQWGRVFIYTQGKDGTTRLITAKSGRIDSSGDKSELVLSDAVATKLPAPHSNTQLSGDTLVVERLAQTRVQFDTGRSALLKKLRSGREADMDEMKWQELLDYAASKRGHAEGFEAATMFHKRLALSLSPLLLAFIGAVFGLRIRRGGRGLGMILSLAVMLTYYLVSLLCEGLARTGKVAPAAGAWFPVFLTAGFGLLLLSVNRIPFLRGLKQRRRCIASDAAATEAVVHLRARKNTSGRQRARFFLYPGLMDINVLKSLSASFLLAFVSLLAIFLVFTLFELWRFIVVNGTGTVLVARYMLFLSPLVTVQMIPAGVLISMLASYALLARRREAIAWWACGQSIYRLMLPGILFAIGAGAALWFVQERVMPPSNVRQDALRAQIRGGGPRVTTQVGRQWLASAETGRLYAYEYDEETGGLKEPAIYEFDSEGLHLRRVTTGPAGQWLTAGKLKILESSTLSLENANFKYEFAAASELNGSDPPELFKPSVDKPAQLSAKDLSAYIKTLRKRGGSIAALSIALQRKYAAPLTPAVMTLIAIPLAMIFGRRSSSAGGLAALGLALGLGLAFWLLSGGFQYLGAYGLLPIMAASWSPLVIFASAGLYQLARIRT